MSKPSKKIDPIEAAIAALPDKTNKKIIWTMAEDAAILKFGPAKGFAAIALVIGKTKQAVHARYHFLKDQAK